MRKQTMPEAPFRLSLNMNEAVRRTKAMQNSRQVTTELIQLKRERTGERTDDES